MGCCLVFIVLKRESLLFSLKLTNKGEISWMFRTIDLGETDIIQKYCKEICLWQKTREIY